MKAMLKLIGLLLQAFEQYRYKQHEERKKLARKDPARYLDGLSTDEASDAERPER